MEQRCLAEQLHTSTFAGKLCGGTILIHGFGIRTLLVAPRAPGLKHLDFQSTRQRRLAHDQGVRLHDLRFYSLGEFPDQVHVIAVMHRDGDLRLELGQNFPGDIRRHRAAAIDGRQGDVDFADLLNLFRGQGMGQVAQVHDAQGS